MTWSDRLAFALQALGAYRLRSALILLSMAIGVASVILLTGLGEGARRYVNEQFSALGANLLIILPGRTETTGGPPPLFGETPRDLTTDDALSLLNSPSIRRVAPIMVGSAAVSMGAGREREVTIVGTTADLAPVRRLEMLHGAFLPGGDPRHGQAVAVLGIKLARELFDLAPAVGQWVRVADRRFKVVGVLGGRGQSVGVDFDDAAIIPIATYQALFDTYSVFRILAEARSEADMHAGAVEVRRLIKLRHEGEDDVTVITQDSVLGAFDKIFTALTLGLGVIAAVSLLVAGVLTMNVMLISVTQRVAEVGLLKALGARDSEIRLLFLCEAGALSLTGAVLGTLLGGGATLVVRHLFPAFPFTPPAWAVVAGVAMALANGMVFGVWPAARAARLNPVTALAGR
jgi:putative ABC transport system permease protein